MNPNEPTLTEEEKAAKIAAKVARREAYFAANPSKRPGPPPNPVKSEKKKEQERANAEIWRNGHYARAVRNATGCLIRTADTLNLSDSEFRLFMREFATTAADMLSKGDTTPNFVDRVIPIALMQASQKAAQIV